MSRVGLGNEGETTCQNFKSPLSHFRVVEEVSLSDRLEVKLNPSEFAYTSVPMFKWSKAHATYYIIVKYALLSMYQCERRMFLRYLAKETSDTGVERTALPLVRPGLECVRFLE